MNLILEGLYPDNDVVAKRRAKGFAPLSPALDQYTAYLHLEMWLCYLNGLDHAAVVMACALVDFAIKNTVYFKAYVEAGCKFDPAQWDKIDALEFAALLAMAKSRGVLTKEQWQYLDRFRKEIRNVYMHGATADSVKDLDLEAVEGDTQTGEVTEGSFRVRNDLSLQRQVRIFADRNTCNVVIPRIDECVRMLAHDAVHRLEQWHSQNPSSLTRVQVERVLENMHKGAHKVDRVIMREIPPDMSR